MSKVTGKFQLTLPKRIVDTYKIQVGDEIELIPAGDCVSLVPARRTRVTTSSGERLRHFDRATERQRARETAQRLESATDRGWTREELYERGRTR